MRSHIITTLLTITLLNTKTFAFTNTKEAHVHEVGKEHANPDIVGYTASVETPNFHFRRIGTTSAATEFAQVTVSFDIVKLRRHIQAIATTVREAAILTPEEDGLQLHMFQQLDKELRSLKDRTKYIYHLISAQNNEASHHKHKRFAFTLAFITMASVVTIGASIYANIEVEKIASDVSNLQAANLIAMDENIKHLLASKNLASIVEATVAIANKDVQAEAKRFWFQAAIREINDHVTAAENAAQAAARGQFSMSALQSIDAEETAHQIRKFAQAANLEPIGQLPRDLLHAPASLAADAKGFLVVIHVPLVRKNSLMGIFQHTPLPMPAGNGLYVSIASPHDTIAISPEFDRFFLTDSVSLHLDCTRFGEFFACPRGNVARKAAAAQDFTDVPRNLSPHQDKHRTRTTAIIHSCRARLQTSAFHSDAGHSHPQFTPDETFSNPVTLRMKQHATYSLISPCNISPST